MPKEKNTNKKKGNTFLEKAKQIVTQIFSDNPGKAYTIKQIAKKAQIKKKEDLKLITNYIFDLEQEGSIREISDGKYAASRALNTITGVVDHVSSRFAYVRMGAEAQDIFIKAKDLGSAVDGDTVAISVYKTRHGEHPEGKVVEVIQRGRNKYVGRIEVSKNYAFVVPDYRKMHQDFFVYPENINSAKTNDKVIVEIVNWGGAEKSPEAKVVEILGKAGENEAEIHSIMAEFGLPFQFPEQVLNESKKIEEGITAEEIKKRWDFRKVTTFTIDPEDAKDFDDALSYRELPSGNIEVGVHIADVTHYVKENTALEEEAFERATSVYLVDRTIPMLPEKLSNELCSLRPNEDKLTFAAVFELDDQAKIIKEWFGRTIIHSDKRFSYEEAQTVLETGEGPHNKELKKLNQLAYALKKDRFKKGAVNFETTEVKFKLDANGKPLAVIPKVRKDAHKLIEEFMLLANKRVATYIYNMKKGEQKNTFVYRTHDNPDPQKVQDFALFAKQFGHTLAIEDKSISKSLNSLMEEIEGKPEQNVLQSLAVRAMAKAKYTTEAKGHFGLAFDHYSHFTSPIRRYPDMMAHRLLQHYIDGKASADKAVYEKKCIHSSEREKRAADAERASIKYKQVEFMAAAEKKDYAGIISGVTEWGIFVEIIETKCEGMIRLADLDDDYYEFDERNYCVRGKRNGKKFTLGDTVKVNVKKTDIDKRLIDLVFAEEQKQINRKPSTKTYKEEEDDLHFPDSLHSKKKKK
ncbi:MAG: ribonuclease R [Cyclobacteriaceae bacterium]|jgi:ribonuclease R|nr:ribonuclease R [Cytophagales bacterium]MCZ8328485.1 ribonuclease R [Cyclobacteriaceae bacterium]